MKQNYVYLLLYCVLVLATLSTSNSIVAQSAQENNVNESKDSELIDEWEDDWADESPLQVSHEISYSYAGIVKSDSVNQKNSLLNELRSKSKFDYQSDGYSLYFELELLADAVTDDYQANAYQARFVKPFDNGTDLQIGRQVITWGTGDLLFLNDLFSKDWRSFFNGRDDSYLKPPVDAVRISHYAKYFNFDLAWLPDFEADQVLTGERYSFYLPGQGVVQPSPALAIKTSRDSETSARAFGRYKALEWSVYAYRGYFKSPSVIGPDGELSYSRMDSFGASVRTTVAGGLLNAEYSHYKSVEDEPGVNPLIDNSQDRYLIGFEKEIASQLTLGLQVYLERTLDYQALLDNRFAGQLLPLENRTMTTVRVTHQAMQQRLLNSVMLFYSPSDEDYYLRYSSRLTLSDNWKLVAGVNLLGGREEQTFLSALADNSNLFLRAQYSFE